jgi:very-short-patch-repair endonuclease
MATKPKATDLLYADLRAAQMEPKCEYAFHGHKGWRFDFAYPPLMLAIEVDGKGRHQLDAGYREDCDKLNAALELGWRVLRYPARSVETNKRRERIVEQIRRVVCGVECEASSACVLNGE